MASARHSKHWIKDIKKECQDFYCHWLHHSCVDYDESELDEMDKDCDRMVEIIKKEVFPNTENMDEEFLDEHKVAAIHTICLLRNPPFKCDVTSSEASFADIFANEHFCLLLIRMIIIGWDEQEDGSYTDLNIPAGYMDYLLQLFYTYSTSPVIYMRDSALFYTLSHIIYWIKDRFHVEAHAPGVPVV